MKRFIRYLYEYEQGKRLRNVGFVKVEQKDEDCTLNIHGKGLHMKGERKLELYLFYDEGDGCVGIWQGTVDNVNPAINYRLFYTMEDVIAPENFQRINGIILESETGRRYAAVWNDAVIDVGRMRVLRPEEVQKADVPSEEVGQMEAMPDMEVEAKGEEVREEASAQDGETAMPDESMMLREKPQQEDGARRMEDMQREAPDAPKHAMQAGTPVMEESSHAMQSGTPIRDEPSHAMQSGTPIRDEPSRDEPAEDRAVRKEAAGEGAVQGRPAQEGAAAENEEASPQSDADMEFSQELTVEPVENICGDVREHMPKEHLRCTKIQRNDIARLPRCEWKWANNSFLLHGYYNYHHLALIDDGEKYRLGVPGIYHPQEAKAASTFGFTEFIPHKDMNMDLTDDEKSSQEQFGYWCRPIKRMLKTQ